MRDRSPDPGGALLVVVASAAAVTDGTLAAVERVVREAGIPAALMRADGPGSYGERIERAVLGSRSDYVAVLDPEALDPALLGAMWRDRAAAGLVLGTPALARPSWRARMAVRVAHRVLSLPVRPDALALMFRRDALGRGPVNGRLPGFPIGRSRYEWLLAAVVSVNADGWPIVRVAPAGPRAPADATTSWATLRRLWLLRNSAFSADYDERAYNSWIPLQRYWQRARYRIITNLVDRHGRILDIGCGSSRIVQALPHAVGLDIQLKKLRRISGQHHRLVQATLTRLPFRDGAFDTLICSQVIEHVPESLVDWREFNRVLAPGGSFVVGTPDYATVAWPVLEFLYGIVHPRGYVDEHINRYTAASLRGCLERHGFTVTNRAYVGGGELIYRARKTASL